MNQNTQFFFQVNAYEMSLAILFRPWCIMRGWFNLLAPQRFEWKNSESNFNLILVIDGWGIFCEIALRWMSLDLCDDESTLVQVMAWCCHHMVLPGHNILIQCGLVGADVGQHWLR